MKFGKKILSISEASEALTSADKWMNYKKLKKLLKVCESERVDNKMQNGSELIKSSISEKAFFELLLSELRKVSKTYRELEQKVLQSFLLFIPDVEKLKSMKNPSKEHISNCLKECAEHHLQFVLLENYSVMNYCGFTKILKKHDKLTGFTTREKYMIKMVNDQPFAAHKKIQIATQLILKEFQLLQKLRKDCIPISKEHVEFANVKKGLEVSAVTHNALVTNGLQRSSKTKAPNRLDDLVNLLEKHQQVLEDANLSQTAQAIKRKQYEITKTKTMPPRKR